MIDRNARRLGLIATIAFGTTLAPRVHTPAGEDDAAAQRLADREAIEQVLARANLGFELSDRDMFAVEIKRARRRRSTSRRGSSS